MAEKYPLVSNQNTLTIEELPIGDTLVADNVKVTGDLTVIGNINADLGNVIVENLEVEGLTNLGNVGNVTITGGDNLNVLATDGSGNLTWRDIQSEIANAAGANTYVQFNNDNLFGASANFTYNSDTNTMRVIGTANVDNLETGFANLGSISNITILGGTNGYVLATNGSGNLSWVQIDPSVSGNGGNASSSVLLLASLNGGNALNV